MGLIIMWAVAFGVLVGAQFVAEPGRTEYVQGETKIVHEVVKEYITVTPPIVIPPSAPEPVLQPQAPVSPLPVAPVASPLVAPAPPIVLTAVPAPVVMLPPTPEPCVPPGSSNGKHKGWIKHNC